jgi:hypothetical protein
VDNFRILYFFKEFSRFWTCEQRKVLKFSRKHYFFGNFFYIFPVFFFKGRYFSKKYQFFSIYNGIFNLTEIIKKYWKILKFWPLGVKKCRGTLLTLAKKVAGRGTHPIYAHPLCTYALNIKTRPGIRKIIAVVDSKKVKNNWDLHVAHKWGFELKDTILYWYQYKI